MTARRDHAPEDRNADRSTGRPGGEGDRRYGDRAADVRPTREPDPDVRGPQEGYDATADAARRTGAPAPDDRDPQPEHPEHP
ncbi:hypothetical protein [Kitasatospora cineracea]|uniref:Uncharacterized protein n=1 Tax=Kitasatospora cineracea TaxID=88074 RepID=A0A3N4RRK8_9ACTN|nr:hypothetical protein [Kitasatospora cineracea]RPE35476.1 hypothetical protein EDD38_3825 [Kitasatospora cineracea]